VTSDPLEQIPPQRNASGPLLSIITVSLNAATTIGDTLASVSMQDADFVVEHLCIDGGSSDATREIIDRWAGRSSRIKIIYEPDEGIYDAMNKGLRAASGEYVLFLNADDFLVSPHTLATAMQGIVPGASGNPDLVVGDAVMGSVGKRGFWRHRRVPRQLGRIPGTGWYPVHQGQFTKRRLLGAVGGFDVHRRLASDLIQYYDLEMNCRPSIRRLGADVAFMQAGGAANAGPMAIIRGSAEIFRHLSAQRGFLRACAMLSIKTLQSVGEIRYGCCPHQRWFIG
jgi:glycosyltransferase involved in cell wall biosynthesis